MCVRVFSLLYAIVCISFFFFNFIEFLQAFVQLVSLFPQQTIPSFPENTKFCEQCQKVPLKIPFHAE
jgi:hypothetical protein